MKRIIILLFMLSSTSSLYASKPLIGIVGFHAKSPRALGISNLVETHIINIVNSIRIFCVVDTALLKRELTKFNCLEEECLLSFSKTAGLSLMIRFFIEDRGNAVIINLYAYGIETPYHGRIVYKYRAEIPLSGLNMMAKKYSYICEEHAGFFISGLLDCYQQQVYVRRGGDGNYVVDSEESIKGTFSLYRYDSIIPVEDSIRIHRKIGRISIELNRIEISKIDLFSVEDGDFILFCYREEARFLRDFYYGRKREIVFEESSMIDPLLMVLFSVPASVSMPVVAPLAHYRYGDFRGLSLWAVSILPYLYIGYDGLKNRPDTFREDRRGIPRRSFSHFRFGVYMILCGGMPLFIDAFIHNHLYLSSSYERVQPLMGNRVQAAYLSLVSGGGGLFYRGYRRLGYIYFHLHNILLYSAIKEFSVGEEYNLETDSYEKEKINRRRAYAYMSIFGFVKMVELLHAVLIKDNIRNGRVLEVTNTFEPDVAININKGELYFDVRWTYRFNI